MRVFLPALLFLLSLSPRPLGRRQAGHADDPNDQLNAAPEPNVPESSSIQIEKWATPESGWLYVLDPKPDAGALGGRVWLVNPQTAEVEGSIRTGRNADFALSPDGSRLYIASDAGGDSSDLAVIDTAQGVVVQTGMIEDRAVTNTIPAFSAMAVSGDGFVLRILIDVPASQGNDAFLLAAFDTQAGAFLTESVHLLTLA